jgi:hypothetical protein
VKCGQARQQSLDINRTFGFGFNPVPEPGSAKQFRPWIVNPFLPKALLSNGIGIYNQQLAGMAGINQQPDAFELPLLKNVAIAKYTKFHD